MIEALRNKWERSTGGKCGVAFDTIKGFNRVYGSAMEYKIIALEKEVAEMKTKLNDAKHNAVKILKEFE